MIAVFLRRLACASGMKRPVPASRPRVMIRCFFDEVFFLGMADSNVVPFEGRAEPRAEVWQCQCGENDFLLHADGRVQCVGCDAFSGEMFCYWRDPVCSAG